MYKNFNTECVMRWCLILEEYGIAFHCIKGQHNAVADALGRLDSSDDVPEGTEESMAQAVGLDNDDLPADASPMKYKLV